MTSPSELAGLHRRWYPIASSTDLPPRHVHQAKLLGREFAVWRADDGFVNVWENRCLHRGVRLSIGINTGRELVCQYHGWRYANRTAGCTYIPAHPADAPARRICNTTYPAQEAYGLVWAGEEASGPLSIPDGFDEATVLRPIPVMAPPELVAEALRAYAWMDDCIGAPDPGGAVIVAAPDGVRVCIFVQLMDSNHVVMRGLVNRSLAGDARIALLRLHNSLMETLRDRLEAEAAHRDKPARFVAPVARVPEGLAWLPAATGDGGKSLLRVRIAERVEIARDIIRLKLEPLQGQLPTPQPGAHIDLHLPNGLVRQYSLTNGPGETGHYAIAVKRVPDSRGGSAAVHDAVAGGDLLAVSAPHNGFALRRDARETVFIAGGIGVTPLISMAQALFEQGLSFGFHYFAGSEADVAFGDRLADFGSVVRVQTGLTPAETETAMTQILAEPGQERQVYVCGPAAMLDAARAIAAQQGWPDNAVHFEYFANSKKIDRSGGFEIDLARSAVTLAVPPGKSILEVLRENGISMASSCEQGACGTCRCEVIEGDIDHQDVYLSDSEKAGGKVIMTCVSRARSARLILDI